MNISDPLRLIKAINDRPQPQGMQKSAERRNWENLLYDSYPDQPVLKAAYSILQTHRLEDRLRNMWMTQPQSLLGFAGEVVKYRDDKLVFEGIASPGIYRLMKEHLLRDGSFRDALTASVSQAKPAQNYEFSQEIENSIQKIPLSKIVICGDRFSSEAQRVISQELFPIIPVFYNSMKRERNLQFETDAVFCVASKIDHNSYYLMRRICRSHEIPFYHLNKKGIDSVVSFVRQVAE